MAIRNLSGETVDGIVGIGTVTPQGKLTVVGAIQTVVADLTANDSVGLSIMGMPTNNFNAITLGSANSANNSAVFRFKYNSAGGTDNYLGIGFYANDDILNVRATGRVGINQTIPGSELHIEGNGGDGSAMLKMNASAGSQTFNWISSVTYPNLAADKTIIKLFGQAQSSNNQAYIGFKYAGSGSTSNQLTFGFYANDFLVNLLANGNLGIGTTSPSAKLDVQSSGSWGQYGRGSSGDINVENTNTSVTEGGWIGIAGYTGNAANNGFYHMAGITAKKSTTSGDGNYGGDLSFWTTSGGANGEANSGMYQRMTIDSSGNVGINNTNPSAFNSLGGLQTVIGSGSGNANLTLYSASTDYSHVAFADTNSGGSTGQYVGLLQYYHVDDSLRIYTNSAERMRIDSSGNVGIGTISPAEKLEVAGSIKSTSRAIAGGSTAGITLSYDTSNSIGLIETWTSKPIGIETAGVRRMTIDSSGNVGIGTTSPQDKLEVLGNIRLRESSSNAETVYISTNARGGGTNDADLRLGNSNNGDILTVHNAYVGIGTTSPAATLDVDDDNTGKIRLLRNGSTRVELSNNANEGELSLYRSSTTKTIYISSYYNSYFNGGKVGIGNTSPAGQLDILTSNETMIKLRNSEATSGKDRDFKLDDNNKFEILDNNGTGVSLSQGSGSWSSESDERLKENIIELDNVLENINNLRAVKYNYKNGNDTKIGFIAQDWQKDFSEVIEEGEHLSMKYTETIPVLLKAIKELKAEIEELKKNK
jgi:hypothetical protein